MVIVTEVLGCKLSHLKGGNPISILCYSITILFRPSESPEYNQNGKWVSDGTGPEWCTDPKLLRKAITWKPDELFSEVFINTFQGGVGTFLNDSFGSLWKPIDFVHNPVSFNRHDPIVVACML